MSNTHLLARPGDQQHRAPYGRPVEQALSAWPSEALLQGHKIVQIAHNGSLYKLQATKLGKLILTK